MEKTLLILLSCVFCVLVTSCTAQTETVSSNTAPSTLQEPVKVTIDLQPKRVYYGSEGVRLQGGNPSGGTYSGPGVKDGTFFPGRTRPPKDNESGTYSVNITYTLGRQKARAKITVFGYQPTDEPPEACPKCHGKRTINCPICHGNTDQIQWTNCSVCDGCGSTYTACTNCKDGKVRTWLFWKKDCPTCSGSGRIQHTCWSCKGEARFPCCPNARGRIECPACSLKNQ